MIRKKRGFTLIELLIVVLIIGVLTAVAMPMYKRAVLKSRFSTVMPMAKAVADAQEVYYLGNGQYALNKEELDITPVEANNTAVALSTQAEEEKYAYVAANRTDYPSARYIVYQKHSPKFAGNVHCEADTANAESLWLCEKGLGGTEIPGSVNTSAGDYKTFLLSGNVGENDKFPTSLSKLAQTLCEGKTNCTASVEGDTVITRECTGSGNNKTCINRTYNDTGTQVDYEKTQTICRAFSNNTYPNATKCTTDIYDEQNHQTGNASEICNTAIATWENGVCTWNEGHGTYYRYDRYEGDSHWYDAYSCTNSTCSNRNELHNSPELYADVYYAIDSTTGEIIPQSNSYWNYSDGTRTTWIYWSPGDVEFTTKNTQTNEVIKTVTCHRSNVDLEKGTCKPGTAI